MMKSVYVSQAARDHFRAYYGAILSRFPFEQRYVSTAYGETFILAAGQESNPPVVLLHGSCSNSIFWFPEIMALSENYRVYAVDIIGEAGNSSEFRPDPASDAFAFWMKDVLDGLGLPRAVFIGNSLGGWMALKFASSFAQRVSKLILLAAAGLAPVRQEFLDTAEKARGQDGAIQDSSIYPGSSQMPKEVLDFIRLILDSYNPIQELPIFTDGQLSKLTMPVLFIDGTQDEIIDAQKSAARLSVLVPTGEIHLQPGSGHVIQNSIDYILPFLLKEGHS